MASLLRILVVDDDEVLRKIIVSVLSKIGTVHALECGNDAIAYLETNSVDLIFSDVCMPNGTGIELLQWVQGHRKETPVVLVTGHSLVADDEASMKGAKHIIGKPFRMKTLLDIAQTYRAAA